MKKIISLCALFLSASLLSSCAFLFNSKTVNLAIDSNPRGADIIIEGKNYGKTPAIINIEPKNYVVNLNKEGYGKTQFNLQTWSSVREGADGKRCILDALSVVFFFDIYTKYCTTFKEEKYMINIPASIRANGFSNFNNSKTEGSMNQNYGAGGYYQNQYNTPQQ